MRYAMAAIETTYSGVRFRSRLEAKWARFFDLCGWPWTYEPYDLAGWIPDFLLELKRPVLVEVKPCITPMELIDVMAPKSALTPHDLLGLGSVLLPAGLFDATAYGMGVHLRPHPPAVVERIGIEGHGIGFAQLTTCPTCGLTTFFNSLYRATCVVSGCEMQTTSPDSVVVDHLFKKAGNDTRWKAKQRRGEMNRYFIR